MRKKWTPERYIQAYRFAALAHGEQKIPGTNLPYVMHLSFVCMEIIGAFQIESDDYEYDEDLAVQCALLHDVIEDTETTYEQVKNEFGSRVADGVLALSKDATLAKPLQMPDSLRRIGRQPREVRMVKLADRISNLQPPPEYWTKERASNYRKEAIEIYDALKDAN